MIVFKYEIDGYKITITNFINLNYLMIIILVNVYKMSTFY